MKISSILIPATGLTLSLVIAGLIVQNNQLRESVSATRSEPAATRLEVGDRLPYVELQRDDDGFHVARLDKPGSPTALFVFSAECGACQATLPRWNELVAQSPDSSIQVLGIQVDDPALSSPLEASFTVLHADPRTAEWLQDIPYVPATILLDDAGIVTEVWYGALSDTQYEEVRTSFGALSARAANINNAVSAAQQEEKS